MSYDLNWVGFGLVASILIFGTLQFMMGRRLLHHKYAAREQIPELRELLVQSLKGGADLTTALNVVADMGPSPGNRLFAECCDKINEGVPVSEAMAHLDDESSFVITYLTLLTQSSFDDNSRSREALLRMEHLNRHAALVSADIDNRLASIHTTSVAVFVLVPLVSVVLMIYSPWYRNHLEHHTAGQILLSVAILLYLVGGCRLYSLCKRKKAILETWMPH